MCNQTKLLINMTKQYMRPLCGIRTNRFMTTSGLRRPVHTPILKATLALLLTLSVVYLPADAASTHSPSRMANRRIQVSPAGSPQSGDAVIRLEQGAQHVQERAGGRTRVFEFPATALKSNRVVVIQEGLDVHLNLTLPGGRVIERDWPSGRWGLEQISFTADGTGDCRLKVEAEKEGQPPQRYVVKIEKEHEPGAEDRSRIEGEGAYSKGLALFAQARSERKPELVKSAVEAYEEAVKLFKDAGDKYALASSLTSLAFARGSLRDNKGALAAFDAASGLWHELGDLRREAQMLHSNGRIHEQLDDIIRAFDYYGRALKAWEALTPREPDGESASHNNIATILNQFGEHDEAIEHYKKAIHFAEQGRNLLFQATTRNNLASAYEQVGEYDEALKYYGEAQSIRESLKERGENYDPGGYASTYHNLGVHFLIYRGDHRQAVENLNRALEIRRRGDPRGRIFTLYVIALADSAMGKKREALESIVKEILPFHRQTGDIGREALTLLATGAIRYETNDKAGALEDFKLALERSREQSDRGIVGAALFRLGSLESERGELEASAKHLDEAVGILEERRIKIVSPDWRSNFLAATRGVYEKYIDVLMNRYRTEGKEAFAARAFEISERAHARVLTDLLIESGVDIYRDADPALVAKHRQLKRQASALEGRRQSLLSGGAAAAQVAELERKLKELLVSVQEADAQVKKSSHAYADLTRPEPLTAADVRGRLLDSNTLLLEYSLGREGSYLFVVSRDGIVGYDLPPRATIEAAAQTFYNLVSGEGAGVSKGTPARGARTKEASTTPSGHVDAARALSDMVLGKAAPLLGTKRLLIVGDGTLHYVPFAALPTPSLPKAGAAADVIPLVVNHEITYLPSASTLEAIRVRKPRLPATNKMLAVLADPVFERSDLRYLRLAGKSGGGRGSPPPQPNESLRLAQARQSARESGIPLSSEIFPRLPKTAKEADAILSNVRPELRLDARDFNANYRTATGGELSDYKYVHFATHGLLNSKHPSLSGVVLSLIDAEGRPQDEGFLRLGHVEELNLPAELVVLSACRTALGGEVRGEGLVGLTRGFMRAGASRVVASLWKADDNATAELMRLFYEGMLRERHPLPPSAALKAAQEQMWRKYRDRSPYFWAAFVMQGEWR